MEDYSVFIVERKKVRRWRPKQVDYFLGLVRPSRICLMKKYQEEKLLDDPAYNLFHPSTCVLGQEDACSLIEFFNKEGLNLNTLEIIRVLFQNQYYKDLHNLFHNLEPASMPVVQDGKWFTSALRQLENWLKQADKSLKANLQKWKPTGQFKKLAYEQAVYKVFRKMANRMEEVKEDLERYIPAATAQVKKIK